MYQFGDALKDKAEADLPDKEDEVLDLTTDAGKAKKVAKRRNDVALASLTMAFVTDKLAGLILSAQTVDWPSGLAWMVIKALFKKYQPQDRISRVEMRQMLNRISMKKNKDLVTLFEQISSVVIRIDTKKIDEEDQIAIILDSATEVYQAIWTSVQKFKGTCRDGPSQGYVMHN